ncbi:hypothetical protein [Ekhidna sp.]|jgi:antitoxin component YwqK of YwqJK toxin-antitoxin module|uniref:toxin-antitoxin system YwqK family antitoxin n=1 Tax=Ekhidna sp. TaxID=2608089 RepID=UPI0032EAC976
MRNLLLMTLLVFITITSFGQLQTYKTFYDPLTQTKLHEEWTAKTVPNRARGVKHGLYKEFDTEGNLIREMQYQNGKQDGYTRIYYFVPDYTQKDCYGKLIGDYNFNEGKKHGLQKDYDCDQGKLILRNESEFVNGQAVVEMTFHRDGSKALAKRYNGINQEWDKDGSLIAEYTLVNGIEDGMKTIFHFNGQVRMKGMMDDGNYSGEWVAYYADGTLMSEFTKSLNGNYFSSLKKYSMDGVLTESTLLKDDLHHITVYDSISGKKQFEEYRRYSDDVDYSLVERSEFYSSGELKSKIQYGTRSRINSAVVFNRSGEKVAGGTFDRYGDPIGLTTIYRSESEVWTWDPKLSNDRYEINFKGRSGEAKVHDSSGVLIGEGAVEYLREMEMVEVGEWEYLYPSGNVKSIGTYSKGDKHGEWKQYKEDGSLNGVQVYQFGKLVEEKSAEEIEIVEFNALKKKLIRSFSDYENQNSNSNVRFYKYRARNSDRYIIFEKGVVLINHYYSQIGNCSDLTCIKSIESKLQRVNDVMERYQDEDPRGLVFKLKLAKRIERLEEILIQ